MMVDKDFWLCLLLIVAIPLAACVLVVVCSHVLHRLINCLSPPSTSQSRHCPINFSFRSKSAPTVPTTNIELVELGDDDDDEQNVSVVNLVSE